jgi:hypothetical protein
MTPLRLTHYTATTPLGAGRRAQLGEGERAVLATAPAQRDGLARR